MLEDLPQLRPHRVDPPRATLVLEAGSLDGLRGNVWMGGAHSLMGEEFTSDTLRHGVVLDCAGEMPANFRLAAGLWLPNVFQDIDAWPMHLDRLEANVARAARALLDPAAPMNVFAMCTHGMNRSGLAAGLVLRALGIDGHEAVHLIRHARPGALSNETFRKIVETGPAAGRAAQSL